MVRGQGSEGAFAGGHSIMGLEELVLAVEPDDRVAYLNSAMARLLGVSSREAAQGMALEALDRGPLGEGVLCGLVRAARQSPVPVTVERLCPGLPVEALPSSGEPRPTGDPVLRLTAGARAGAVHLVLQDVTRQRWLEATFSRYVSPAVIEQLERMDSSAWLRMSRREVTILSADLRGFSGLCQELHPEEVQELVNAFLGNMLDCVDLLRGTVEKFEGDGVMAIFGAPLEQPDHALRGLVCALEMQQRQRRWIGERRTAGRAAPALGVGVSSGPAVVGNVGTRQRLHYTALGHTTNLSARLCGLAEGGEVLTSPETREEALRAMADPRVQLPRLPLTFTSRGELRLKNLAAPVEVLVVGG
ncbi:MAG: adenylate/guanylate cyclase domain-containing protein [Deltaproteobacteria bacterium]|nr:adenylate/guanylate cyclase domain-containing protein [Deltaproteobacteria bacterium]